MAVNKRKILASAQRHVQKGAFDRALKDYLRLLEADPRDANVRLKVGDLQLRRNQPKEAIDAYLKVADQFMRDGFDAKAVAIYKQVTKIDGKRYDVYLPLSELYQRLGLVSEAMAALQSAADGYQSEGKRRDALDLLRKMSSLDPSNVPSRLKVADLLAKEDLQEDAIAEYDAIIEEADRQGDWETQIAVYERILEVDPRRVEPAQRFARLLLERNQNEQAEHVARKCVEADDEGAESNELLGDVLSALGKNTEAVPFFKQAAAAWRELGDEAKARDLVQRHVSDDDIDFGAGDLRAPGDKGSPFGAAVIESEIGFDDPPTRGLGDLADPNAEIDLGFDADSSSESASEDAAELPELVPEPVSDEEAAIDAEQLLAEASVYIRYGKHEKAIEAIQHVLSHQPDNVDALEQMGDTLAAAGHESPAVEAWVKAGQLLSADQAPRIESLRTRIASRNEQAAAALGTPAEPGAPPPTAPVAPTPPPEERPGGPEADPGEIELENLDFENSEADAMSEPAAAEAPSAGEDPGDAEIELGLDIEIDLGEDEGFATPPPVDAPESKSASSSAQIAEDLAAASTLYESGDHSAAETAYRAILEIAPNHPGAQLRLGEIEAHRAEMARQEQERAEAARRQAAAAEAERQAAAAEAERQAAAAAEAERQAAEAAEAERRAAAAAEAERQSAAEAERQAAAAAEAEAERQAAAEEEQRRIEAEERAAAEAEAARLEAVAAEEARLAAEAEAEAKRQAEIREAAERAAAASSSEADLDLDLSDFDDDEFEAPTGPATSEALTPNAGDSSMDLEKDIDLEAALAEAAEAVDSSPGSDVAPSAQAPAEAADAEADGIELQFGVEEDPDVSFAGLGSVAPEAPPEDLDDVEIEFNDDVVFEGTPEATGAGEGSAEEDALFSPLGPEAPIQPPDMDFEDEMDFEIEERPPEDNPTPDGSEADRDAAAVAVDDTPEASDPVAEPVESEVAASPLETVPRLDATEDPESVGDDSDVALAWVDDGETRPDEPIAAVTASDDEEGSGTPTLPNSAGDSFDLAAELSEALSGDPSATASFAREEKTGSLETLFSEFKRGVEEMLGEGDVETHFDLGIAYREMGLFEDAIGEFQHALESETRRLDGLHMMALCALELGRPADAMGHLEQALSSAEWPEDREAPLRFDLGRAYAAVGDAARALDTFRRVAEIDPTFGQVTERIAELENAQSAGAGADAEVEAYESFDDLIEAASEVDAAADAASMESFEEFQDFDADDDSASSDPETPPAESDAAMPSDDGSTAGRSRRRRKVSFI